MKKKSLFPPFIFFALNVLKLLYVTVNELFLLFLTILYFGSFPIVGFLLS